MDRFYIYSTFYPQFLYVDIYLSNFFPYLESILVGTYCLQVFLGILNQRMRIWFIFFHFLMCGFNMHLGIGYEVVTGYVTMEFTVHGLGSEYAKCRRYWIGRFPDGYTVGFCY